MHSSRTASRRPVVLCAAALLALAVPAAAQEASPEEEGWKLGPGVKVKHSSGFRLELAGYVQGDGRDPRNLYEGDEETESLNDTVTELRRFRIGLDGEWGKRVSFQVQFDPADEGEHLKDLWLGVKLADAFRVRAGHFKVPVSREFLVGASRIDFIERSMVVDHIGPGRDWGLMLHGEPFKDSEYMVGVFKGDGGGTLRQSETTVAGRLVVSPFKALELGGSFSQGDVEAQPAGGELDPAPLGFPGIGPSGFRFYDSHFVHGKRQRLGADARITAGPFAVGGEWMRGTEEREGQSSIFDDLPDEVATGWSAAATWLVTGEKKKRTIEPGKPIGQGGIGAIELAARIERLHFDDDAADVGFAGSGNRARNIRAIANRVITAGLSWWPVEWIRLMGNLAFEEFSDPLLAPEPGRTGKYVTVLGRLQFSVP
ncbi:MAG TPA: porin [Vicinamibacteria bacterium]|nr:porin [Vicinamibacteria bacterium]